MADFIVRWLDLFDTCERAYNARDHPALNTAFAALFAYDHSLIARERMAARIARWRRDSLDPLPPASERAWWGNCLCRLCAAARLASVGELTPWQRQQRTLKKQQQHQRSTTHVVLDQR